MSNKVVVISNKDLQNFAGLQCFVQQQSAPEQETPPFLAQGGPSAHNVQVSVSFESEHRNSITTISSNPISAASLPNVENAGGQNEDDESPENSENESADENSYQDNDTDSLGRGSAHRLLKPPSIHLRYTGTRIPGRGFDGGVGKCIIYRDGIQRELTVQEVIDILTTPDLNKLSTMPPVRPRGGAMYLYRCPDFETRHDLRADGYLWCQQGTKRMPKEDPVVKRFFMYVRCEEPIKNVSRRPKKTFTKYDVRFKKFEYELINAEDALVLVHYVGDETAWKPFSHMQEKNAQHFQRTLCFAGNTDLGLNETVNRMDIQQRSLPEEVPPVHHEEQVGDYLNYESGTVGTHAASAPAAKRPRPADPSNYNEAMDATDHVTIGDTAFDAASNVVTSSAARHFESSVYGNTIRISGPDSALGRPGPRTKFQSVWPTYELCKNEKMEGFVHALSILPQVAVTASSKSLLRVANDLAQLSAMRKTDRFEFYYVSAGPVANGYYLSTLLFRHCLFDLEPIVPLAFLIHERRNVADHRRLFELIKAKCPDVVATNCIFITDREYGNISTVLPKSSQLYSWHYIEDDVVNWVESSGGTAEEANAYLSDVYSLMKLNDAERFVRELAVKRRHWTPAFTSFFDSCLKADIIDKAGRWCSDSSSRHAYDPFCGIVIPSCNYLNDLVGDLVSWHQASLEQLLQCLHYFSEYYVREIERSMHQVGSYKLLPQFAHYSRPPHRLRKFPDTDVTTPRDIITHVRFAT